MKKGGILTAFGMMAATASTMYHGSLEIPKRKHEGDAVTSDVEPHIPAGAKQYFFNIQGEFSTERMLRSEMVFNCVSINDKNAIRKFNKWKFSQLSKL